MVNIDLRYWRKINLASPAFFWPVENASSVYVTFHKCYCSSVYPKVGSKQTELPIVVSFQACGSVYVGTDPRLANSSQVLVKSIVFRCIPLGYQDTVEGFYTKTLRGDLLYL